MPSRNVLKRYGDQTYYHIYNRGVEKRNVFREDIDYLVLLNYIKEALLPEPEIPPDTPLIKIKLVNHFDKNIELVAFCLMPNHYHLLLKQANKDSMEKFMRSVFTRYSMYFNKKSLFISY